MENRPRSPRIDWRQASTIAVGIAGGAGLIWLGSEVGKSLRWLLTNIVIAFFLAACVEPAVIRLQRHMSRRAAAAVTLGTLAGCVAAAVGTVVPAVVAASQTIWKQKDTIVSSLADASAAVGADPAAVAAQIEAAVSSAQDWFAASGPGLAGQVGSGVAAALAVTFLLYYLVVDGPHLRDALARVMRRGMRQRFLTVWNLAMERVGKFIAGNLILAVIAGGVTAVVAIAVGLPNPVGLALWATAASMVPFAGGFLAATFPVLAAVVVDVSRGGITATVVTVAVLTALQAADNYLLRPKVLGATMAIHPAIAFLAVIGGTALLGAVGAFVSLPVAAVAQVLFSEWAEGRRRLDGDTETTREMPAVGREEKSGPRLGVAGPAPKK